MATYQLPVPHPMSLQGDVVENWKEFEDAWEDYMIATKLNQKTNNDEQNQVPESPEVFQPPEPK